MQPHAPEAAAPTCQKLGPCACQRLGPCACQVGDDAAVGRLLEEGGKGAGAKGRAQQIALLAGKLRELQRRVEAGTAMPSMPGSNAPTRDSAGPGSPGGSREIRVRLASLLRIAPPIPCPARPVPLPPPPLLRCEAAAPRVQAACPLIMPPNPFQPSVMSCRPWKWSEYCLPPTTY